MFIALPEALVITVTMMILTALAIWGISESLNVIGFITLVEVAGLLLVILASEVEFSEFTLKFDQLFIHSEGYDAFAVFQGAFLAFYAFVGFEDLANVAEEAKKPKKSMPIAIMGSLIIGLLLYVVVAVVAVLSLPLEQLSTTDAPMADIMLKRGPAYAYAISMISLVAVLNGVLAQVIMGSRVLYGLAGHGGAPKFLHRVHEKFRTPVIATLIISAVIVVLAVFVPIVHLANATSYVIIVVFTLVNLTQGRLAYKDYKLKKCWRKPKFILPVVADLLCVIFISYKTLANL